MNTKVKLLVIDDDENIRDMLSLDLGKLGYIVVTADSGMEGIEKVKNEKYELAIIDLKMPNMDGLETLQAIKTIDPDIEVIIVTGYSSIETAVKCIKKGAYDYINKPHKIEELCNIIEKALEKKELKIENALYKTSKVIFSFLKLDELLDTTIDLIMKVIKADDASIMLFNSEGKLYIACSTKLDEKVKKETRISIGERIAGRVVQKREPVLLVDGLNKYPEFSDIPSRNEIKSSIVCPLITKTKILGVINFTRTNMPYNFTEADLRNITIFSSQVAQAIENAELYQELNDKAKELEKAYTDLELSQQQLVQAEKMAALGQLASGTAHELNNPLTAVLGTAQILLSEIPKNNSWYHDISVIEESTKRCKIIIENMLVFARQREFSVQNANINDIINSAFDLCQRQIELKNIKIIKHYEKELPLVSISISEMQQVFLNIIINAQQSMPKGGTLTISTKSLGENIEISFADTGKGVSKENINRIFDPFFTTKEVGKGTGLGLSVSCGIIQKHNGTIKAESEGINRGAKIIIILPTNNR